MSTVCCSVSAAQVVSRNRAMNEADFTGRFAELKKRTRPILILGIPEL